MRNPLPWWPKDGMECGTSQQKFNAISPSGTPIVYKYRVCTFEQRYMSLIWSPSQTRTLGGMSEVDGSPLYLGITSTVEEGKELCREHALTLQNPQFPQSLLWNPQSSIGPEQPMQCMASLSSYFYAIITLDPNQSPARYGYSLNVPNTTVGWITGRGVGGFDTLSEAKEAVQKDYETLRWEPYPTSSPTPSMQIVAVIGPTDTLNNVNHVYYVQLLVDGTYRAYRTDGRNSIGIFVGEFVSLDEAKLGCQLDYDQLPVDQ